MNKATAPAEAIFTDIDFIFIGKDSITKNSAPDAIAVNISDNKLHRKITEPGKNSVANRPRFTYSG
jgi:hypothetical protein